MQNPVLKATLGFAQRQSLSLELSHRQSPLLDLHIGKVCRPGGRRREVLRVKSEASAVHTRPKSVFHAAGGQLEEEKNSQLEKFTAFLKRNVDVELPRVGFVYRTY